jgi:drug/metabolite transporter (DMT)-like permease
MAEPAAVRRAHPLLGVALISLMGLAFAVLDNAVRWLGAMMPVLLVLSWRYATQALVMAVWLLLDPRRSLRPQRWGFQVLRGSLLLATSALSFYGVQHMQVAEFTAINMLTPVLVTLLAAWLLKERVSAPRWVLVGLAFTGALVVIRPGAGIFGWEVLFPLGCACTYASFQVLTSRLSGHDDPLVTHFWTGAVGTAVVLPVLWASGVDVAAALAGADALSWAVLIVAGLAGTTGHLMLILALGMAPASTLMPFVYTQIASATLVGWLVFGHLPDGYGWLGMAIIALAGAASAWLNLRRAPTHTAPTLPTAPTAPAERGR